MVRLTKYQDDQERRTITDWLTSTDFSAQQTDFISRRQEGTGQWLLDSEEYKKWNNENGQSLFCPGIPGAGKTIITSIVIDNLQEKFKADEDVGIAFLYCSHKRQQEQKFEDLMASLLKQLVQERHVLPDEVKRLYQRHVDKRTRPSIDEVMMVLRSAMTSYSRVFFVIDALDECENSHRKQLLKELSKLQAQVQANVFATSRFLPDITTNFNGKMSLEIRATEEDVRRYLENQTHRLPGCVSRDLALQKEITTQIIKAIDGMYVAWSSE